MSTNNTIIENNVNSNISPNCDTHFVTSKLGNTTILIFTMFIFI